MSGPSPRLTATPHNYNSPAAAIRVLADCGVPTANVKCFTTKGAPELLDYLDLCPSHHGAGGNLLPDGVAESRERPLLYFIRHDRLSADRKRQHDELSSLRRVLGSRGERAYLAIVEPGLVRVAPVSLDSRAENWEEFQPGKPDALSMFARMALGEYEADGAPKDADYVFTAMFGLLTTVANNIVAASPEMERDDVLSLVGRALFLRFLGDRRVVTAEHLAEFAPGVKKLEDCFADGAKVARTCKWLDATFNGDFLPLSEKGSPDWFSRVAPKGSDVFKDLRAILRDEEPAGGGYQQKLKLDWSTFDFAHVPVGLLSQVYEGFVWKWDPQEAGETSVHYTPRGIAEYLVEDAFDGMRKAGRARVLDPACGAGVFLVLAFRRLYRERWKAAGQRPQRTVIRDILNRQLCGFDISESSVRLAALSLYLTAIELDPKPTPPHALRFKNLRNKVLFNCRRDDDPKQGPVAGSLDAQMLEKHRGRYQMVLCNPPWTSLKESEKELAASYQAIGREVLAERKLVQLAKTYENPDSVPDLPFMWRAMQWCESGGRMAFVLHARLLFKQGDIGQRAREAIFQSVAVTGMLNCSNLSDTNVWPGMQQPFLLFFARNRMPKPDHTVRWITAHHDKELNDRGEIRVDSKSIEEVSVAQTFAEPWLWKALALGTALDIEVVRKVKQSGGVPLQKYWEEDLGLTFRKGYIVGTKGNVDECSQLDGMPVLKSTRQFRFKVDVTQLDKLENPVFERPREERIYRAPLVVMKEAPGSSRKLGMAWLVLEDVAFNESFYGASAAGHPDGESLVRYLQLLVHADIWMHYALLTSPKFGAERRKIYKEDLEGFPILPWAKLSSIQRTLVRKLSNRLIAEDAEVFAEIDDFFAGLYGLKPRDMEVIRDTLSVELPFKPVRAKASLPPSTKQRREFCSRMEGVLRPFFKRIGQRVAVRPADLFAGKHDSPFSVVAVTNEPEFGFEFDTELAAQALELASGTGASMAFIEPPTPRTLLVGILNHARYWTNSRARLCATRMLWEAMDPFER